MTLKIHNRKVFAIAVSCGCALATLCWLCYRLAVASPAATDFFLDDHPLLTGFVGLPSAVIYYLLYAPDWLARDVIPGWLGELVAFSYYPAAGVLIGRSKRWPWWCVALVVVHAALLGLSAYVLSQLRFGF